MSTITKYFVQAKKQSRWETLGPFEQQEEGEQAFQQIVKQNEVTYARFLASGQGADGQPFYQVLRVFQRQRSGPAGRTSELLPPVARAAAAPVEAELERPKLPRQLESAETSLDVISHNVVYYESGEFNAWPANQGGQAWQWGNEILVGFFNGIYEEKEGHNWAEPVKLLFARSTDGGETWSVSQASYGEAEGPAPGDINFAHPDFALRIFDELEGFFISFDRGGTWAGPYNFGDLLSDSPVAGDEFTSRTDYIVNSASGALFFMSSRRELIFTEDYAYMAKTSDGGASFDFVSFIDPFDIRRNVMPSTVRISDTELVTCVRRKDNDSYWIETYRSTDNGESWSSLGQLDRTGDNNGNPAALVRLPNGHLVCIYGVRQRQGMSRISAKVSSDSGSTWGLEQRLRDDYVGPDAFGDVDLGYPRAFVRPDGKIVTVYYWATSSRPEQHIAATVFQVAPQPAVGIGPWIRGLTHEKESGANRLLLLTLHYVEKGTRFKDPQSVRYGGQTMGKLLERNQREGSKQTYVAMFYLLDSDIQKSADNDFQIDWDPNRPDNWEAASVFLSNVAQTDPFGDKDTGAATSGNQVACHPFQLVAAGEAVVLAGTARRRGSFTLLNDFEKGDEFDLIRAGVRADGDAVVGHKAMTETADQQSIIAHSNPGTMVIASVQVHQATTL